MTYHCGVGPRLARIADVEVCEPHLTCDGCGIVFRWNLNKPPPMWLLDRKAPRGWRVEREEDGGRSDYCTRCKGRRAARNRLAWVTVREQQESSARAKR